MKSCLVGALLVMAAVVSCSAIDRNAFTFTHYNLDVRVEPEQQRLAVRGRVTLRNDSGTPQKNAVLQISSSLDWRSIQVDGKAVQFVSQPYTSDIDHTGALSEAIVSLPSAVAPKASLDIDVGYEGVIPLDTTRLKRIGVPEEVAKHSDWDQISPSFTAVRGVGYVVWYPVAMDAADMSQSSGFGIVAGWKSREQTAAMNVNLCVTSDQAPATALMNDAATAVPSATLSGTPNGDPATCSGHQFAPMGLTVPAVVLANFHSLDAQGMQIFYLPGQEAGAKSYASALERVMPFVKDWFGDPKVSEKVAQLNDPQATPFETGNMVLTPFNSDEKLAEMSMVHAAAHSAFPSPRAWIYEGLAHFAQALWRQRDVGRQGALDFMGLHRTALAQLEQRSEKDSDVRSLITTADEELYRSKAMFVWWMLREMIGEPALKRGLAAYRGGDDNAPSYMPKLIQAQTARDLKWFFDDWVYHDRGLPDFRVASVYASKTEKGIYLVTVSIENLGDAGAEVPFTVRFEGGEVTKRLEVRAKSQAVTRIEVPSAPTEVIVNDGSVPESDMSNNTFKVVSSGK